MPDNQSKIYNLPERTINFSREIREYIKKLPKLITNIEIGRQLMRSAGSVGANYIEADEALSRKDFNMRIKICRKEVKESRYWLELSEQDTKYIELKSHLIDESTQLIKIFATIIRNSSE
jgi:four helix bundle protein